MGKAAPTPNETVMSSPEVLDGGVRVTRAHRFRSGWMFLSATESDESEPIWIHFSHLLELDPGLNEIRLRKGEYALRPKVGGAWVTFGPLADDLVDELMDNGVIDAQHRLVIARAAQ